MSAVKREVSYEVIFPYDGNTKTSSVNSLLSTTPSMSSGRATTYDKLTAEIKSHVDKYLSIPKYFDLRNFADKSLSQNLGLSLIVSQTPEVSSSAQGWVKFKNGGKTVYCSLIVSSGDFFSNFNLPEEVLNKATSLRDSIVRERFHSNWYFNSSEISGYPNFNPSIGQEKRVFRSEYFNKQRPYGHVSQTSFVYYRDSITGELLTHSDNIKYHPSDNSGDISGNENPAPEQYYIGTDDFGHQARITPNTGDSYFYNSLNDHKLVRYRYDKVDLPTSDTIVKSGDSYFLKDQDGSVSNCMVSLQRTPEIYDNIVEDLKKDFIDLEVTRRILHSNNLQSIPSISAIPTILSGVGSDTVLSYPIPSSYSTQQPLPLNYSLIRDSLNNKDPYGDQETLLIMWVSDRDPAEVEDNNITGLYNLSWKMYAIPVLVRCRFKDTNALCQHRFLVSYPLYESEGSITLKHHNRCTLGYSKTEFREALYLADLMRYSKDYLVTHMNNNLVLNKYRYLFNAQYFLFRKCPSSLKQLYIAKKYASGRYPHQEAYYVSVDPEKYSIDSSSRYFQDTIILDPISAFPIESYKDKWSLNGDGDWKVYSEESDGRITYNTLAIFDLTSDKIKSVEGYLTLDSRLREDPDSNRDVRLWDHIHVTPFGLSPRETQIIEHGAHGWTESYRPIGFLDGYIKINGENYGSRTPENTSIQVNGKAILGFSDTYDYSFDHNYHFEYRAGDYVTDKPYYVKAYYWDGDEADYPSRYFKAYYWDGDEAD